jgi:hypothetical protein
MSMNVARNLVLTLSVGDRPWFPLLRPYMEAYARRWGAEFEVITQTAEDPAADALACRREKVAAIHRATARYERVLFLDDTIFVRPDAPVLEGPPGGIAKPPIWGTLETHHPRGMALLYAAFQYYGVPRREWTLLNSGVMLVREEHHSMFDLTQTKPMKTIGYFADQLWINVMQQKHAFPVHDLGPRYNFVGSFLTGKRPAPIDVEEAQFFHITRAAGEKEARLRTIERLLQRFG